MKLLERCVEIYVSCWENDKNKATVGRQIR